MKRKQIKAGIILTYLTMGLGVVISLLYTPLMLRMLPQGEYGIYTIAQSIIGYLSILSFGINSTYVRYFFKEKQVNGSDGVRNINGCFLFINLIICVIAAAAGTVLVISAPSFFRESFTGSELAISRKLMIILTVNLALSFPFSVFSSFATAQEQFILLKLVGLIRTITSPLVSIAALMLGTGSVGMVLMTAGVNLLSELFLAYYCITKLSFRASIQKMKLSFFRDVFIFSFFVFLQSITDQINWSVDSIVLGKVCGAVTVAVYGLASQLNGYFRQFSTAISAVYAPKVNHLVASGADNHEISSLYIRVSRLQLMIVMFVLTGFCLWGRFFVVAWGGKEYADSFQVAVVLMAAIAPAMFMNVGMEIRRAKNKHKVPALAMLATSILNLSLTIPLALKSGAVGAAIATLFASYVNTTFLFFYYKKVLGLEMVRYLLSMLKVLPAVLLAAIGGYGISKLIPVHSYYLLFVSTVMFALVYWLLQYVISMDENEKQIFLRRKHR